MQKTKRILSVIVAMLMLFSIMVPMTSATEFTDVATTHKYYEAISNLSAYGIINGMGDGKFAPDDTVTRAQFTKMICVARFNINPTSGVDTGFSDVASDHWAAGHIRLASANKIINGRGNGIFAPEDPVKFEEAVKMIVCALGYGNDAEKLGVYPVGYLTKAGELGLLKGVAAEDNKEGINSTRAAIAKLIDNMLDTEQYTETGEKGSTIKEQTLKTVSVSGQVVSVYGSTIYADETSKCGRNQIEIVAQNGKRLTFSVSELDSVKANINDYLGKRVTVYYSSEDELQVPVLTNFALQAGKNDITVVDIADINDYSNTKVEYLEDGDTEEISVRSDANILENGVATDKSLSSLIKNASLGQITFLDSDVDGDADVIFVKTYKTMIVKSKTSSTFKVYGENGESLVLDDEESNITIKKNDKAAEFNNISAGDVLSYASSAGDEIIDVLISNTVVSGSVSQINATRGTITIRTSSGDKVYKRSSYFEENYKNVTLEVGTSGKFHIDAFGKIAKVNASSESAYTYAYLTGVRNAGTSMDPIFNIQVIKINGSSSASKVQYTLADKFKIDGTSFSDSDTIDDIEEIFVASAENFDPGYSAFTSDISIGQVIKFTLNTAGKIDKIITVDYDLDEDNNLKAEKMESIKCTTASSRLDKQYIINSAKVLILSEDKEGGDKYSGAGASYFKANGTSYNLQFIDMTEGKSVPIIIVYGSASAGGIMWEENAPMVVTGIGDEIPEGNTEAVPYVDVITHTDTDPIRYYESEENAGPLDDVAVGDVIRINLDGEGYIDEIKEVTTLDEMIDGTQEVGVTGEGDNKSTTYAEYRHVIGTVNLFNKDDTGKILGMEVALAFVDKDGELDASEIESFNIGSSTKVVIVDSVKIKDENPNAVTVEVIEEVDAYDSKPDVASKVLVYTSNSITAKMVVVFK